MNEIERIDQQIEQLKRQKATLIAKRDSLHPDEAINKYLHTWAGKRLLEIHSLTEQGNWEVKGEDPNCDLGGSHSNPHLGYFEGTLENVIKTAVNIRGFYQWGAGGEIKKIEPVKVIKV